MIAKKVIPYRRKKIFINKGLQLRYAIYPVIFVVLAALTMYLGIKISLVGAQLGSYAKDALQEIFKNFFVFFLVESIIFVIICIYVGIKASFRIAGPAHHFKKAFQEIMQGNYGVRVQLRKGDELKGMASEFNKMAQALEEKEKGI